MDPDDDGNTLFDFDTYEEFRNERLKLNYENTLKIWYSLPSGLPGTDNERVREHTTRQQRIRKGKAKLFVLYYILFNRTFLRNRVHAKGKKVKTLLVIF